MPDTNSAVAESTINYETPQLGSLAELSLDVDAVRQVRYLLCTNVVSLRSRLRQHGDSMLLNPLRQSVGDLQSILQDIKEEIARAEVALWRLQLRSDDGECPVNTASRQSISLEPVVWL